MKKKILSLIIVMAVSAIIVGCGGKNSEDASAKNENNSKVEDSVKDSEKENGTGGVAEDKPEENKTETVAPEEKPKENSSEKPEEKPATKPVEKPATKPETKPTPKPEEKPETKPEEKPATKPEEKPSITLSAEEVINKITAGIEGPAQIPMEGEFFADQYGIDTGILKSYKVMAPMMIVSASECAVFQVKDVKDIDKVKVGISKRLKYLEDTWKQYLPQQYELVKNNKVVVKDNYVLFVISESADTIVSNFNNLFK